MIWLDNVENKNIHETTIFRLYTNLLFFYILYSYLVYSPSRLWNKFYFPFLLILFLTPVDIKILHSLIKLFSKISQSHQNLKKFLFVIAFLKHNDFPKQFLIFRPLPIKRWSIYFTNKKYVIIMYQIYIDHIKL